MPFGVSNQAALLTFSVYLVFRKVRTNETSTEKLLWALNHFSLTNSGEVGRGSRAGGAACWSLVDRPVEILAVVLGKATHRVAVKVAVH